MSVLWTPDNNGTWIPAMLEEDAYALSAGGVCSLTGRDAGREEIEAQTILVRMATESDEKFVLLCPVGFAVRVNGSSMPLGLRVLRDHDLVEITGSPTQTFRAVFSNERKAKVVAFAEAHSPNCPRCIQPIAHNDPAAQCVNCQAWFHASQQLPCFDYAPCSLCGCRMTLGGDFLWTPNGL